LSAHHHQFILRGVKCILSLLHPQELLFSSLSPGWTLLQVIFADGDIQAHLRMLINAEMKKLWNEENVTTQASQTALLITLLQDPLAQQETVDEILNNVRYHIFFCG